MASRLACRAGMGSVNGHFDFGWPRWAVMWTLAFAVFGALKLLSWLSRPSAHIPTWKHLAFLLAWPGMNAGAFLSTPAASVVRVTSREWFMATFKTSLGVSLTVAAFHSGCRLPSFVAGWLAVTGLVLTLHCGSFHLLSCFWRTCGLQATPIMNSPLAATSVSDFWSRRWNLAFRDLTSRFVVRPLSRPQGATAAVFAGFVISGLIHDLVMSVPAGGGYGGPTLYFLGQGIATWIEHASRGRRVDLSTGVPGRLWAWAVVLLPTPLLLHKPFIDRVILPFVTALGELS